MSNIPSLRPLSTRQRVGWGALIGLCVALLLGLLRQTDAMERAELATLDARTHAFLGQRPPDERIVLAVVTEADVATLRGLGVEYPWEEDVLAFLVPTLKAAGAKGLLFDLFFFDRGLEPSEIAQAHADDPDGVAHTQEFHRTKREFVEQFAARLADYGRVGAAMALDATPQYATPPREQLASERFLHVQGAPSSVDDDARSADFSVAAFLRGVRWLGFVNAPTDLDGVVRRVVPLAWWQPQVDQTAAPRLVPSLAVVGATLLNGEGLRADPSGLRVGGIRQALDAEGMCHAQFSGHQGAFARVSPARLIDAGVALAEHGTALPADLDEALRGKLVIWGANVDGREDIVATPIASTLPGPEWIAHQVDNLLHGDARVRVSSGANFALLLLLCVLFGAASLGLAGRVWPFLLMVLAWALVLGGVWALFGMGDKILDLVTPMLGIGGTSLVCSIARLATEGRRNRWLEGTFSRYLAPDVIASLKSDPTRLELGGRRREITVFFSDIAGFTSLSERLSPEQVVHLVNRYLTGQSNALMAHDGVIDKFEGDAIMSFFGDPLDLPNHAEQACRAAVACQRALAGLRPELDALGIDALRVRIGMNTGPALVGNMGSEQRFDYTCMGDTVNLASRLEGANKHFGSTIMIGPRTYAQAEASIVAKPLADLVVVGKQDAVAVHELLGVRDDAPEALVQHAEAFATAHGALRAGAFSEARSALDRAEGLRPGDGPCAWLREVLSTCEQMERPWDGRVRLHSK